MTRQAQSSRWTGRSKGRRHKPALPPAQNGYSRSNTAAMPCPPPTHIVTSA